MGTALRDVLLEVRQFINDAPLGEDAHVMLAKIDAAETGEQWAHICWLEAEIVREERQHAIDNSQFGVGA